jgi:hypothetical protein
MHNLFQSDFILIKFTNQLFNFLRYPFDFKQVIKYNIFFQFPLKMLGPKASMPIFSKLTRMLVKEYIFFGS